MNSQMPANEHAKVVVMYCPSCGVGVQDVAANFMGEYPCPECGRPGYFRQNPPLVPEMTLETPVMTPAPNAAFAQQNYGAVPDPQTPANPFYSGVPPVSAQAAQAVAQAATHAAAQSGGLFWKVSAVVIGALALGGLGGWRYTVEAHKQAAQAQEQARKQQQESELQNRFLRAMALTNPAEKAKALQELQAALQGTGSSLEALVASQLAAAQTALAAAQASEKAEKEKLANEEAAKNEAKLAAIAQALEQKQAELAAKEAQAAKAAEQQRLIQAQLAEKERQQQAIDQRLQQIEGKLNEKVSAINEKEAQLQQQQKWVQDQTAVQQAAAQQAAAQQLAQQQAAAQQAASQQVVIVKEPVPVTTTYIVKQEPVVPVVVNTWSFSWGPRPRPVYIGPGPRPWPYPHH